MGSIGQLDYGYIKAFFNNMPIYPIGCRVRLSSGEIGIVAGSIPRMHLRPVIQIINEDKEIVRTAFLNQEYSTFIVEVLYE